MLKSFSSSKLQQYNNTHNPFGHNQSKNPQSNIVGVVTTSKIIGDSIYVYL